MTGLKSGSGDDLWGDDGGDDANDADSDATGDASEDVEAGEADSTGATDDPQATDQMSASGQTTEADQSSDTDRPSEPDEASETGDSRTTEAAASGPTDEDTAQSDASSAAPTASDADDAEAAIDLSAIETETPAESQSYIVRRAVQDKSVQFERDERLTFFVHDDVAEGERDLVTELQSVLGRDVPKFDVREAVYRAALRNPDDVLEELLEMGYSIDEE